LHTDKNAQSEFMTTQRGMRLATSIGGTLTGRGGNLIIIDDPHKADEVLSESRRKSAIDWYRNTLVSRLDNKQDDAMILIQQRLHEEDLAGYLLESGDWYHLNLPAFAEDDESIPLGPGKYHQRKAEDVLHKGWESKKTLEHIKKELGSYTFAAQYQQRPVPIGGGMVKWNWFKLYDKAPEAKSDGQIVQSWDTANKAEERHDWSVCTTWLIKDKEYYLLHIYRVRLEFPALKRKVLSQALEWGARTVLIEDKAAGTQLIQDLKHDKSGLNIIPMMPTQDKQTRMMAMSPAIEAGRVFIPKEAHWLAEFRSELLHFPNGKHDDQIDSLSQFLEWAENHCRRKISSDDFHLLGESIVLKEFTF
ncbi:MAG: phage terminase large subunit, partial [Alphaproteobacteria bacterium]|nr:phage terminase large subunit [Alphaproteobacteria bacterium]